MLSANSHACQCVFTSKLIELSFSDKMLLPHMKLTWHEPCNALHLSGACVQESRLVQLACMQVVETCHNAGLSKLVVKLRPIAVIKG